MTTLVIVPCGSRKVWDVDSGRGPTPAQDAYIGVPFKVNRKYAERFADRWVILSAKFGFIPPNFPIHQGYDVTFKRKSTQPISLSLLRKQALDLRLQEFDLIICLGGAVYSGVVRRVFDTGQVVFPFEGLSIGRTLRATKAAVVAGEPLPVGVRHEPGTRGSWRQ